MRRLSILAASTIFLALLTGCGGLSAECESLIDSAAAKAKRAKTQSAKEQALRDQWNEGEISFEEMQQGIEKFREARVKQREQIGEIEEKCGDEGLQQYIVRSTN